MLWGLFRGIVAIVSAFSIRERKSIEKRAHWRDVVPVTLSPNVS